jgi:serine/threonine protein kinase
MRSTRHKNRKSRRTRRTRRTGGGPIASGSYGCVYKPSIPCGYLGNSSGNRFMSSLPDHVTKYMNKKNAEEERAKGRAIRNAFDEFGEKSNGYIMTPNAVCNVPDSLSASEKAELASCKVKIAEPYLLQMRDGGIDLDKFQCPPEDIHAFMSSLLNLIEGLLILHGEHMAHMDIKPGNIVTQKEGEDYLTRFVDVGMMADTLKYDRYTNKSIFRNPYVIWPFEVRYLAVPAFISTPRNDAVDEFYAQVVDKLPRYNVPNNQYFDAMGNRVLYADALGSVIRDFYKRGSTGVNVERVAQMTDIYSLGYTFAGIFNKVFGFSVDSDQDMTDDAMRELVNTVQEPMLHLVQGMMNPNPEERFDLLQVKEDYTKIVDAISKLNFA